MGKSRRNFRTVLRRLAWAYNFRMVIDELLDMANESVWHRRWVRNKEA